MKKTFVSVLALLLAALMVFSLAACKKDEDPTPPEETPNTPTDPGSDPTQIVVTPFNGNFTYNDAVSSLATNWNVHTYQTSEDSYPIDFIAVGLYGFIFNDDVHPVEGKENFTGYKIIPEMAASEPVDVTEAVKAAHPEFNIPASATSGYAYTIDLNPNAVWENGVAINADTYVYSMQKLLDPQLKNYRADDYCNQGFSIAGAKAYRYQGTTNYEPIGVTVAEFVANGGNVNDLWIDMTNFWNVPAPDGGQWASVTDDTMVRDPAIPEGENEDYVSAKYLYETYFAPGAIYEAYAGEYLATRIAYPAGVSYDTVGLYKSGDYQITLVLDKSLAGFQLLYHLTSNWIVYQPLYDACLSQVEGTDAWTSSYCTSKETTISYGPYKMTAYTADQSLRLERNETWYGYTDGQHIYRDPEDGNYYNMYQTTAIVCKEVADPAIRKLMFLKGQLMGYGLQSEDFETYRSSEFCYATPAETIFFFIFNGYEEAINQRESNPDFDQSAKDLQCMLLTSFRKAMAVTYDKDALCAAVDPARTGGFGIIGSTYIYDPETGARYRDTDVAKQVLCDFYSVDVSQYASLDDAVNSITGYDPVAAKVLFTQAFQEALEAGYITDADGDGKSDQTVEIEYSLSAESPKATKIIDYLNQKLAEVLVGTPFEGKIVFKASSPYGNAWSEKLKAGLSDTALAGWSGSVLDPFGLTDLYCNPTQAYDGQWFNGATEKMTFTVNGTELTMSLKQWSDALNGTTVTIAGTDYNFGDGQASVETRLSILAAIESKILETYDYLPMIQDASMSLLSKQVYYVVEEYNAILGRGGITYLKYNYSDEAWAEYVASQPNGEIPY